MEVNCMVFLTTISENLYYRTAQHVSHKNSAAYQEALSDVFRIYKDAGFCVSVIWSDNEFCPLIDDLSNVYDVTMNFANPQEHVPEAERNNRVIKERVRATYHRLPYRHLTKTLVKTLVSESAKKINFLPAKHVVSQYYSPRMISHQPAQPWLLQALSVCFEYVCPSSQWAYNQESKQCQKAWSHLFTLQR